MDRFKLKIYEILDYIKKDNYLKFFLVFIIISVVLRYYGLHNAENTDEYNEVFEALRIASGHLNINRWLKKGYQTLLAIEYGGYYIFGWIAGAFKNPMHFASTIVADMTPLFLIGRVTTATLGTLSIIITYLLGKKMFNKKVGFIGACFFSVIPMHIWCSHLVNTDVPMTFFSLLALLFIWSIASNGRVSMYALAGLFIAIAINCKMLAVSLVVPFFISHFIHWKENEKGLIKLIISKEIAYTFLFFMLGFVISNPAIIIGLPEFINDFFYRVDLYKNYDTFSIVPYSQNAYYDYYIMLKNNEYGLPLFLVTIFGLFYSLANRKKADYILFPLCISLFLLIANTNFLVQNRYMMLLVAPSLILSARFLVDIIEKIKIRKILKNAILIIACVICIIFPTYNSVKYVISLAEDNTSKISKVWIEENIPAGSKILLDAGKTMITFGPRLNQSPERIIKLMEKVRSLNRGETYDSIHVRMVDSYSAIYFELLVKSNPKITYDIISTVLGTQVESIDYYRKNGFDYIITNSDVTWRLNQLLWRRKYPKSVTFYESLDKNFKLIKTFKPTVTRSGSTIKIYKVK